VRTEVRGLREREYILAARSMGGGFFYLLFRHFAPAFFSSIAFQAVSGIGGAIGLEATLSFLGIGLPVEAVSWGSLLQASERALLTEQWWMIFIPGALLVLCLLSFLRLADALRRPSQ